MSETNQLRLPSHWSEVAFAVAWVGTLSVYWIHIKMNVHFQALLRLGLALRFPLSLVYVSLIYIATVAAILWTGLGIYLTLTGGLSLRRLLLGVLVILLIVAFSFVVGIFLNGLLLSPVLKYMTLWLPLFLALWLSIWAGLPRCQLGGR
jgi:hypothetical protein